MIFPNKCQMPGLVCDTFSGKSIFHNCTKHFPNESRIFYKLWKEPIFPVERGLNLEPIDNKANALRFFR